MYQLWRQSLSWYYLWDITVISLGNRVINFAPPYTILTNFNHMYNSDNWKIVQETWFTGNRYRFKKIWQPTVKHSVRDEWICLVFSFVWFIFFILQFNRVCKNHGFYIFGCFKVHDKNISFFQLKPNFTHLK